MYMSCSGCGCSVFDPQEKRQAAAPMDTMAVRIVFILEIIVYRVRCNKLGRPELKLRRNSKYTLIEHKRPVVYNYWISSLTYFTRWRRQV